jgi:hypothetical protein
MGELTYSSIILDLGTRWRWVVTFTPRPHFPRGKIPRYSLDRRLGGPQSRSGRCGGERNLALAGNRTPAVQPVARRCTDWAVPTPALCHVIHRIPIGILCSLLSLLAGCEAIRGTLLRDSVPEIGIARQVLVKASHIRFEKNLPSCLGGDTRLWTDRHDLHIRHCFTLQRTPRNV